MTYTFFEYDSPIGVLRLVCGADSLLEVLMEPQRSAYPFASSISVDSSQVLQQTVRWLDSYFSSQKPDPSALPLNPEGTQFQLQVWKLLSKIPYGQTVSYGKLAAMIAEQRKCKRMSAQAVGHAIGANPIGIIIPCHRVIGAKGQLTGYAGDLWRKQWLLHHEGRIDFNCLRNDDSTGFPDPTVEMHSHACTPKG